VNFETWLQEKHPGIPPRSVAAVIALGAEGGTVPFIARYRREAIGGLDEVAVLAVLDAKEAWDEVMKREAFIVGEIEAQAVWLFSAEAGVADAPAVLQCAVEILVEKSSDTEELRQYVSCEAFERGGSPRR
jgi:transcriptional accessory protein Tex/SPT6